MKPCAINIADSMLASATLHMTGTWSLALHISDTPPHCKLGEENKN